MHPTGIAFARIEAYRSDGFGRGLRTLASGVLTIRPSGAAMPACMDRTETEQPMAIDPVRHLAAERRDSPLDIDLLAPLRRIAALPPSPDAPYVTAIVDWRPDGGQPNFRPGRDIAGRRMAELLGDYPEHTPAHEALSTAKQRIEAYFDGQIDPAAQTVYVVAGGSEGVFEPISLGMPMDTQLHVGPAPLIAPLAEMVEDHPAFAVLVADQRQASLLIVNQTVVTGELELESTEYPRHQMQGGWSQRRYQMRADERMQSFARTIVDQTQRVIERAGIDLLILAGDEVILPLLDAEWHPKTKEKIVGRINMDVRASEAEVIAAALPVAEQAAREREQAAVDRLVENMGGPMAVGGVEQTLLALEEGRVMTLVMAEDFHADGWVDYSFPIAGVGRPGGQHPAGGDPGAMVEVGLEEEMIRLAMGQDADVEIVHGAVPIEALPADYVPQAGERRPRTPAAERLDEIGGVGAILRYAVVDSGQAMPEA